MFSVTNLKPAVPSRVTDKAFLSNSCDKFFTTWRFLAKTMKLLLCWFGLWSSVMCMGLLQERVFKVPYNHTANNSTDMFVFSQVVVFTNRLTASIIFGLYMLLFQRRTNATVGYYKLSYASVSNLLSRWFKFEAFKENGLFLAFNFICDCQKP